MQNQQAAQEALLLVPEISLLDGIEIAIIVILLGAFLYLVYVVRRMPGTVATDGSSDSEGQAYGRLAGNVLVWGLVLFLVGILIFVFFGPAEGFKNGFDSIEGAAALGALVGIAGTLLGTYLVGRRLPIRKQYLVSIDRDFFPQSPEAEIPPEVTIRNKQRVEQYLNDYFTDLTTQIYRQALQVADREGRREEIQSRDVAQACIDIAPGRPFPVEQTLGQRIGSSITGITVISAILAVIFGIIGFAGLARGEDVVKPFIDIAQIFAGAVVGSTGAAAVASRAQQ